MKQNFYILNHKNKLNEFISLLHLPYTLMAISFVVIGAAITNQLNIEITLKMILAYFLGLGIAAHTLDQLPGMGTIYTKKLTTRDLCFLAGFSLISSIFIGIYAIFAFNLPGLIILIPLQVFFAIAYPMAKLFNGYFHTDFWFAISFGFLPVFIGSYANGITNIFVTLIFAFLCFLIAYMQILLSRYVRKIRKFYDNDAFITYGEKPEQSLKILCVFSYALCLAIFILTLP